MLIERMKTIEKLEEELEEAHAEHQEFLNNLEAANQRIIEL